MATLLFSAVGTALGGPLGGAIGALVGRQVDGAIFGGGSRQGPRVSDLKLTTSSYGMPIPRHFGRMRIAGQIIWATDLVEHRERQGGGKGKPSITTYSYTASFAVALSSRPIMSVGRIWADGKLLRGAAGDLKTGGTLRVHTGAGDQPPDPLIAAAEPAGQCPAHRGTAYAVFEDLQLGDYGNRIPTLSFEVFADQGQLALDRVFADLIEDVDAALPLHDLLGFSVEGPLIDLLVAFDPLIPIACDACDERLAIRPDRLQGPPLALPEAAISTNPNDFGGKRGFALRRGEPAEQPIGVLRYYDVSLDYQPGTQRAAGRPLPGQPRTIELPAALEAESARTLLTAAARTAQWGRQTLAWRVVELDPVVRPGAIVTVPDHPGQWRVNAWEWRDSGIDLTLARLSPLAAIPAGAADSGRSNLALDAPLTGTLLAAVELPWDGNASTPMPLIVAYPSSAGATWPGAALYVDQGDGALQPLGPSGRNRAVIGQAETALGFASPLRFDRAGSVTVRLAASDLPLHDATMRQLAMGANRALLGSEIIQFAQAAPLGAGRWTLSGLLRGRGGTEAAVAGHVPGEAFVLLDGGLALDPAAIGTAPQAALAAIGLADPAPVTAGIALRGIGGRPLSPVHGWSVAAADGAWQLGWTRRARGGWLWQDGGDAPLGEQAEAYEIEYGASGAMIARWTTASPGLNLTGSEAVGLLAAAPAGIFTIRQRGDRGLSQSLTIPHP